MDLFYSMIPSVLLIGAPIIIAGIGGIFAERSGIVNIALEGIMLMGAFFAATICYFVELSPSLEPFAGWIGIFAGMIAGGVFSLLLAVSVVTYKADHTIAGTAINMLSSGITVYLCQIIFGMQRSETFRKGLSRINDVPVLSDLPIIGKILFDNIYPTIYLALIIVIFSNFILFKTRFGLRLRSCGENPHASAAMGINVYKTRYIAIMISGCLAGIAGSCMVLSESTQFTLSAVHGIGFISIAAVIFGKWMPYGVLGTGLFFGFSSVIGIYASQIPILNLIPSEFFSVIPYVVTIIALIIFSGKSVGPKASGQIYDEGKR